MSFLYNIQTYLVISFILTGVFLYKFLYRKLDDGINKKILEVKNLLANLDEEKVQLEKEVLRLKDEILEINNVAAKKISDAEKEAKKISERSSREISALIQKRQIEYDKAMDRIKSGLSIDLQHKMVASIINQLIQKVKESKDNRDFQNVAIENSIEMLEDLVEKRSKKAS